MAKRAQKDLFHGTGNSTKGLPMKVKNKAGKTDPEQRNAGNLLPTKKVVKDGWNK